MRKIDSTKFKFISNEIHTDFTNNSNKLISNDDNSENSKTKYNDLHNKYILFDTLYKCV